MQQQFPFEMINQPTMNFFIFTLQTFVEKNYF